jgi:hypothetical protein
MWQIYAWAMVLGVAMLMSGCPNYGMDHAKLVAAREFYDQPVNEQTRTFRQHPLEDQLGLFFFGNQIHHPPAIYLAPCFALNGPPAAQLLRSKLGAQLDDLSVRDIAALLGMIDMMGQYDVAGDKQLVSLLSSRIAQMKDQNWRQTAEGEVSSFGKRRTETASHAQECGSS